MSRSDSELHALSIRQPWAWAICAGIKRTENRTWSTKRRGTVAIHASTSIQVVNQIRRDSGCSLFNREIFTTGAIIGLAEIVEIASYGPQHESDPFAEGPYCWTLANGRFLQTPIPLKGKLNLFRLDATLQAQLLAAPTCHVDVTSDQQAREIAAAMQRDPDPISSYEELFHESIATGYHRDALSTCGQRLIDLAPDSASGYLILGASRLSESETSGCIDLLKKATELAPDHALSWYFLTDAYLREEKHELAVQAAEETMRLIPDNAMAFENRGRAYFFAERFHEAISDLNRAIEMQPNDAGSIAMRAECKTKLGDRAGALADIELALTLMPDDPDLLDMHRELSNAS